MDRIELKAFAKSLPGKPGVYQMKDDSGKIIYVGKAKNLKNRVASYFSEKYESSKTQAMANKISTIDYVVTNSEPEALLLESNLIKEYMPRYNIIFRDDKSYPYLHLTTGCQFPRLSFYRGNRKDPGRYYGPYPNPRTSRKTLNFIQKLFKLRQCDDAYFKNRTRPCLQYQINRCSAPCVKLISNEAYAKDIHLAELFLKGKNEQVMSNLTEQMTTVADNLDYEKAAKIRDQIIMLRTFQESQHIISGKGEADYIVSVLESGYACIQVFTVRGGRNLGNKSYFPSLKFQQQPEELITAFIKQYYLGQERFEEIPKKVYLSHKPDDVGLIKKIISGKVSDKKVQFITNPKGERAKLLDMAILNASLTLKQKLSKKLRYQRQFENLSDLLKRDEIIQRIECFDISHHSGKFPLGSCVVHGVGGAIKSAYRKYSIKDVTAGDDYQAMEHVLRRHYSRMLKEELPLPEIILIDGGKGQLSRAELVMKELQLEKKIQLVGIAKGPGRKAGLEKLYISKDKSAVKLKVNSPVLHLLQEIRDEAHRFAITGHRQKHNRELTKSPLDEVDGIGVKRKQNLILHFGGMQGIKSAGVNDIAKVPGISRNLALKIYSRLH